jgi:hypothetical protein
MAMAIERAAQRPADWFTGTKKQHRGQQMTWPSDELREIAEADDLRVSPFREDGVTYGTPTWIWSVAVDGALYARAYNGQNSRWHRAAIIQRAGRIAAAGLTREVAFAPVDGPINDRFDHAYRTKYLGNPYLGAMIGARAPAATVEIMPRDPRLGSLDINEILFRPTSRRRRSQKSSSNGALIRRFAS